MAILGPAQAFLRVDFWMETALPASAGFVGTKALGQLAWDAIPATIKPAGTMGTAARIATDAVAAGALSWGAGMFFSKKAAQMVFVGGVVAVGYSVLRALLGGTPTGALIGLNGLGDDLSDSLRSAVAQRVQAELSGLGTYQNTDDLQSQRLGMGEFINVDALRAQNEYAPSPAAGTVADYDPLQDSSSI
jgi:hypothetical protein